MSMATLPVNSFFIGDQFTAPNPDNALCFCSKLQVMCYQYQGGAGLFIKVEDELYHFLAGFSIKIACGLVGK